MGSGREIVDFSEVKKKAASNTGLGKLSSRTEKFTLFFFFFKYEYCLLNAINIFL